MRLLIRPDGSFDRRAVMLDAHRQFRLMKANGWSFARCLAFSSSKARAMAAQARPTEPERASSLSGPAFVRGRPGHAQDNHRAARVANGD
jgi:hypothetical protein